MKFCKESRSKQIYVAILFFTTFIDSGENFKKAKPHKMQLKNTLIKLINSPKSSTPKGVLNRYEQSIRGVVIWQ